MSVSTGIPRGENSNEEGQRVGEMLNTYKWSEKHGADREGSGEGEGEGKRERERERERQGRSSMLGEGRAQCRASDVSISRKFSAEILLYPILQDPKIYTD